jgi:hypothetical protein
LSAGANQLLRHDLIRIGRTNVFACNAISRANQLARNLCGLKMEFSGVPVIFVLKFVFYFHCHVTEV